MVTTLTPQERQHYGLESDLARRDEYGMTGREARHHALFVQTAWFAVMARRAEYEQECAQDRANGHRPHYCIHGTNQWTDYDNICAGCEDSLTDAQWADVIAHKHVGRVIALQLMHDRFQRIGQAERAEQVAKWLGMDFAAALDPSA